MKTADNAAFDALYALLVPKELRSLHLNILPIPPVLLANLNLTSALAATFTKPLVQPYRKQNS